jgi:IS30 family transposase
MGWVRLSFGERVEIARGLRKGWSIRDIAAGLARAPSTISREVARNGGRGSYHARRAQGRWRRLRCRPKPFRLETNRRLARVIARRLVKWWSPEQIAGRLRVAHPDDPRWWVSSEAIYHSLFVQGRGALRAELTACLRTGRTKRTRRVTDDGRGRIPDLVPISQRPAEARDRAVPGHWEGDLINGTDPRDYIVTLVERSTRYVMLGALPKGHGAPRCATC